MFDCHTDSEGKFTPGDNPTYTGNGLVSNQVPAAAASQNINHKNSHHVVVSTVSVQERDFDNPIYSSDPGCDANDVYTTIPDSPLSIIYDQVVDNNPGVAGSHPAASSGHEDAAVYYSIA